MEYFKKITQQDLCNLIESTENSLFLCLPSIPEEIKDSIHKLKINNNAIINMLINMTLSDQTHLIRFRQIQK